MKIKNKHKHSNKIKKINSKTKKKKIRNNLKKITHKINKKN